jgi:hypothetical protein
MSHTLFYLAIENRLLPTRLFYAILARHASRWAVQIHPPPSAILNAAVRQVHDRLTCKKGGFAFSVF